MLTFDVNDLAERLPEMLAEVEAGREVLIARGSEPVARVRKEPERSAPEEVEAAIASIQANRKNFAPITIEEIIAWKNEGHR